MDAKASVPDKARLFVSRKQVSANRASAVAAARLKKNVEVCIEPAQPTCQRQLVILQCSCGHAECCKVLTFNSVHEAIRHGRDPTACPAQRGSGAHTFSEHVVQFYEDATQVFPGHLIVWDWRDIPGQHLMHFDATLVNPLDGDSVRRIEIDGKCHFPNGKHSRRQQDFKKDDTLNNLGVSMLRLHHNDEREWRRAMLRFQKEPEYMVVYTASFEDCLIDKPEYDNIRGN